MLNQKVIFVNVMAILLILMATVSFGAKLTINSNTQMDSLTISDDDEAEVSDGYTVDVNGTVTIGTGTGGTLTMMGSSQMECLDTFTNNTGGTINANTSQITFDGGVIQSINAAGATLYDVVFSTGAKSIDGGLTIGNQLNAGGLDVTIAGGSTLTLGAGSSTTISGGTWTLTGTLTCNATSTINYTSGSAQNVLAVDHGHLTHNGAGTLSLTTDLTCAGLLTNTTGDFTPGANTITADGIVWTAGSITGTPSGTWDIGASGVDINGGTFVATTGTFTCGGDWNMAVGVTFTPGTYTVNFDDSGSITSNGQAFYSVTISNSSTVGLNDKIALNDSGILTIESGSTFSLAGNEFDDPGTITNSGTFQMNGDETITDGGLTIGAGLTKFVDSSGCTLTTEIDGLANVEFNSTGQTFVLGENMTYITGNITVASGTTLDMADKSLTLADGKTVTNNGTWAEPADPSTFTCSGTAEFAGDDVNFFDLSCTAASATLTFAATKTYQVDGALTLDGQASGTKINLQSDTPGSAFIIQNDGGSESVQFVSVQDCEATTNPIHATSSSEGTNVTNWIFSIMSLASGNWSVGGTWVGGEAPGSTENAIIAHNVTLDTDPTVNDLTVNTGTELVCTTYNMSVGGDSDIDGTVSITTGTYTATGASDINGTITIATGTYDADGNFDATGGTITFSDAGNLLLGEATITSLGTLSTDNGTVNYDSDSAQTVLADEYYNLAVSGGSDAVKTLGENITVNGNLTIAASTELDVSGSNFAISVAGNWSNSGTFTAQNGTVTFTGGDAQLLTPGTGAFHNLIISNTSEVDAVTPDANVSVTNDLTLNDGEFKLDTSNPDVTISHALSIADGAVWTAGTGTLTFTGDDCTLSDANATPNNLGNVSVE